MTAARGREQPRLGIGTERARRTRQQDIPHDLRARRAARLAGELGADAERPQPGRQYRRMGRFSSAFAALECDEASAHLSAAAFDRFGYHPFAPARGPATYIRLAAERNRLITSSEAASITRCEIEPAATLSAACTGTSRTLASPRQICRLPIDWPSCTGARTGPV